MAFLARLMDARRYLEIGTFTGYSSLAMTMAMPPDGRTVACDISEEWTNIAQRYWRQAGVAERIRLELRPALETLETLLASGAERSEEHTSELQSRGHLVCRLLLEKKKNQKLHLK